MNFRVVNKYKSIDENTKFNFELNDYVIISGENGSGKSNLLEALQNKYIIIDELEGEKNGSNYNIVYENFKSIQDKINLSEESYNAYNALVYVYYNNGNRQFNLNDRMYNAYEVLDKIKLDTSDLKNIENLIFEWIINESCKISPFNANILLNLFYSYKLAERDNSVKKVEGKAFLTEENFEKTYGKKPWKIINNIIYEKAQLDFKLVEPEIDIRGSLIKYPMCINKSGEEFNIPDLSSGEKVLLLIALSIFSSEKDKLDIPDLILLDEVDASLHPSMIKNLLYLIEEIFVKENNIKVILTTHSPTTVALANEESLYYMQRDKSNRLIKIKKDEALKRLAKGIPTLSVTYNNRINVITESKYDAENLDKIYRILVDSGNINSEISLNFIPSANTGDCILVNELVSKFNDTNVVGIIDWDRKNISKDKIKVLAEGERYTMENCIFDPILLSILLIQDIEFDKRKLGLEANFSLISNEEKFISNLQNIVDNLIYEVKKVLDISENDKLISINYVGGLKINIPEWYLQYKGHELESKIIETFKELNKYKNNDKLIKAIISKMNDYPKFIPMCFFNVFNSIKNLY